MSGDKDGLLYWPKFFLDHSSISFASWLGLFNWGSLRAQSPLSGAGSHFGILSPTDSKRPGAWLYYFLMPTCFRCSSTFFTQVHLLIDGSVEGQYITHEKLHETQGLQTKFHDIKYINLIFIYIIIIIYIYVYIWKI